MKRTRDDLLSGFRAAMEAERAAYEFYKLAADNSVDAQGKVMLHRLAAEELEHWEFFLAHYTALQASGELGPNRALSNDDPVDFTTRIFSPSVRERIQDAHFELSALAIGVQLEANAIALYRAQAEHSAVAGDDELAAFFRDIAEWEMNHYRALMLEQDELRTLYWTDPSMVAHA